ncbi:2-dehydro-3-deoxygalactonokinase [Robiginitomaculum antarcticum]|uniref:2-dehydro-3-deoxygalactonokinase n=1 Tax=Robiginitomaculum antarcticum TaxID=437507 RepID=UPI00036D2984|nr:2-dehydro-3-deoxygalactonokinase [Robiginitomaculum antarcticum]
MADDTYIIAGMWGTTNLTLSLVNSVSGAVKAEKVGPGISRLSGRSPEDVLFSIIDPWTSQHEVLTVQLSGMVGSTLGWVDVPYLKCPLDIRDVSASTLDFTKRGMPISIVPGLSCENPFGHPDVMRGEETELLSWTASATDEQMKNSVLCIPGTHAKWVQVKDARITSFFTSVVGEVYQVIAANGVLAKPHYQKSVKSSVAFFRAVKDISAQPENLMNLLFTTRANTVVGRFTDADATDYLSGLLIGADVNAAIKCFGLDAMKRNPVPLIGASYLTERYKQGLSHWGVSAETINAAEIGAKGLFSVFQSKVHAHPLEFAQ